MGPREGWLKCEVSEGMLPEEYTVQCNSSDGSVFSFFAPQEYINPQENLVKVDIMGFQSGICLIYIPSAPLEGSISRTVRVPLADVIGLK